MNVNLKIKIRKALPRDSEFLFNLRNEESVRAVSLNSDPIKWENHQQWFKKRLVNPNNIIFISELEGKPVAQTRYDVSGDSAEASIAVVKDFRGRGLGSEILKRTAEKFWEAFPKVKAIHAFINLGNKASVRSFGKAGYQLAGQSDHGGLVRDEMVLSK